MTDMETQSDERSILSTRLDELMREVEERLLASKDELVAEVEVHQSDSARHKPY